MYDSIKAKQTFTLKCTRPLGWGLKVKSDLSENGHVAYQIKGSDTYNNIVSD